MKPFFTFVSLFLAVVSPLSAHSTGHEGGFIETVQHFVSHPDHLLLWGTALLLGVWLATKIIRSRKAKIGQE